MQEWKEEFVEKITKIKNGENIVRLRVKCSEGKTKRKICFFFHSKLYTIFCESAAWECRRERWIDLSEERDVNFTAIESWAIFELWK